jgi:ATP-dependent Clp protease ATP-binding subunit ClpB
LNSLRQHFRPEFINRLDESVVFRRLEQEQIRAIVDIQLGTLRARLAERDINLEMSDGAKDYLAEIGFDPQFGARPLKRAIQRSLEDALARKLLGGEILPGTTVQVERGENGLELATGGVFRAELAGSDSTPPRPNPTLN